MSFSSLSFPSALKEKNEKKKNTSTCHVVAVQQMQFCLFVFDLFALSEPLAQAWANSLTRGPLSVLKIEPGAGSGTDRWSIGVNKDK